MSNDTTDGIVRVGGVVVLSVPAARACLDAVLIAERSRRLSGLPLSAAHRAVAQALTDALRATDAQSDGPETPAVHSTLITQRRPMPIRHSAGEGAATDTVTGRGVKPTAVYPSG